MPISFNCHACKAKMTVPDAMAGKRGKCSKCKAVVSVPGANGPAAPPPAPAAADRPPAAREPQGEVPHPTPPPPRRESPEDAEITAAAALADEPKKEEKPDDFIAFNCPQCDEPVKLGLELAGKKHPCPSCTRIISVPRPAKKDPTNWRDKGASLPSGAKRDVGPAPEDAWGTGATTGASREALEEAGVIPDKHKPLTLMQRSRPYVLLGLPVLLLIAGGAWGWHWLSRMTEESAYREAMEQAKARAAAADWIGDDGRAALYAYSGEYQLHAGNAAKAREEMTKARALAASRGSESDALLLDLLRLEVMLNDLPAETEKDKKTRAADVQKLLVSTLSGIADPEARLEGLARAVALLVERKDVAHVLPLTMQVYPAPVGERKGGPLPGEANHYEALAVVALELTRAGASAQADEAARDVLKAYAGKERPELRPSVVALFVARGQQPPERGKSTAETTADLAGQAAGLARKGQADEARKLAGGIDDPADKAAALLEVAAVTGERGDVEAAIKAGGKKSAWSALRLVELGRRAKVDEEHLATAADAVPVSLGGWARLLVLRSRLTGSKPVEWSDEVANKFPKGSLGGKVARLEVARHDTRLSRGWASKVRTWEEGPRAFGSLGAALGMQGK
jgi:hypothetical protein